MRKAFILFFSSRQPSTRPRHCRYQKAYKSQGFGQVPQLVGDLLDHALPQRHLSFCRRRNPYRVRPHSCLIHRVNAPPHPLSFSPHLFGLIHRVALRRHPHNHRVDHPCRVPHRLHGIHRVRPVRRAARHLSARRTAREQVAYKPAEHAPKERSHHLLEQFIIVSHSQCLYVSHHLRASHPRRATSPSSTFPPAYTHFFNSLQISLSEAPR